MQQIEKIARIRLIRSNKIGPVTFSTLLQRFGTAVDVIAAMPEINKRSGINAKIISAAEAEDEIAKVETLGGQIFAKGEEGYPEIFMNYLDTPGCISVFGHPHLLEKNSIAIVGSRNASANACSFTEMLAQQLTGHGFVITSGLARGIDASAHRGALAGGTIAVVAGGLNKIYPKENTRLYEQIKEQGVILSEMPIDTMPTTRMFPIRNRLIAALSQGVVVAEANAGSGSLITTKDAADREVEVMAFPGSPLDPRSSGCNKLIKDGAHLVQNAEDIVSIISSFNFRATQDELFGNNQQKQSVDLENHLKEAHQTVYENLSFTPTEVDELIRQCHLSPSVVQSVLLKMELDGEIARAFGNRVHLLYNSVTINKKKLCFQLIIGSISA